MQSLSSFLNVFSGDLYFDALVVCMYVCILLFIVGVIKIIKLLKIIKSFSLIYIADVDLYSDGSDLWRRYTLKGVC